MKDNFEGILRGGQFKRIIENSLAEIRKKTGLKRVEIEVLYFVSRCGDANTMKDICYHLQMNKGHISIAMDSLCKRGYILQEQDAEDRRYIHYTLNESAYEIVEQIDFEWNKMMECLSEGISQEDMNMFKRISGRIWKNLDKMLKE